MLGANDGIVSTASLILGVAATSASRGAVLTAGVAGLVAGAASMAAGEFVSVGSQRDAEQADLEVEREELARFPDAELRELTEIYVRRGLDRGLARQVAEQLHDHDALGAHLRDELGIEETTMARPAQAAVVSASSFAVGASLPLLAALLAPAFLRSAVIAGTALVALALAGAVAARAGGAGEWRAAGRVILGGGLAMGLTAGVGALIGVAA